MARAGELVALKRSSDWASDGKTTKFCFLREYRELLRKRPILTVRKNEVFWEHCVRGVV